jgi:hypothetical protein
VAYTPPPVPAGGGRKQNFASWAKAHHIAAGVAADIQYWAKAYGINVYYFGAVLLAESGARHVDANGRIKSSGQAVGIGQIALSWIGRPLPWGDHHKMTAADLQNYNTNLRLSAYLLNDAVNQYGYQGAYLRGYNPNDRNNKKAWSFIQKVLPRGIIPGGVSPVGGTAAEAVGPNTGTQAMQEARQVLDPIYLAYSGRRASNQQVKNYLRAPISTYQLTNRLSNPKINPHFYNSPIWQTNYPSYEEIWKNIYGQDSKPDRQAITYAIVHNLGSSFAQRLRDRPDYNTSQEYKGLYAQYGAQYGSIYGTPDGNAATRIDMAVRKGWNADQWKQFLRAQPEWQSSGEYQKLAIGLSNSLGFEPGLGPEQTVLNT